MSKGLEGLDRIKQFLKAKNKLIYNTKGIAQIERELKAGEKYKKALEIINKKGIDIDEFNRHDEACTYNAEAKSIGLTNEEFYLLKEVLE